MGAAVQLRRDGVVSVEMWVKVVGYFLLMHLSCAAALSASRQKLLEVHNHLRRLNKTPLKIIQSPDGDIIDCVHISHQPAFDHPLLKDHKIQMRPSYHPEGLYDHKKMANSMAQLWHMNGKCPNDTIPIRRTKKDDVMRASSLKMFGKKRNTSIHNKHRSLDSDPIDQSDQYPDLVDQSDQDPDLVDQSDPDSDLVDQSDTDPDIVDQSDPDPDLINQSDPDSDLIDQSDQDPDLVHQRVHEYAIAYVEGDEYYGAKATLNVWKPEIQLSDGLSLSQIWILGGDYGEDLNTIEAGWQVNPNLYGDNNARLFTYWTNDAYQDTGCYNLVCSGFIQTNSEIAVGGSLSLVSGYQNSQYDFNILIWKDPKDGNWWLKFEDENVVGYWPSSLFSKLSNSASKVEWGGEIVNTEPNGEHTSTQMGSGHFAEEGYGKSSYVRNIQVVDSSNNLQAPQGLVTQVDDSNCYDIQIESNKDWGDYFYFGGPGRNPNCI